MFQAQAAPNPNRVAAFVSTKRPGMLVGGVKADQLENLIRVIKEAKASGKGIVFFLWQNKPGSRYVANLTVAVERDREDAPSGAGTPIGQDPLAGLFPAEPAPAPARPAGGARSPQAVPPSANDW